MRSRRRTPYRTSWESVWTGNTFLSIYDKTIDYYMLKWNYCLLFRQRLEEETKKELQREHIEKIKRIKEKNLQDKIQEKIRYDPKDEEKKIERKTRELRYSILRPCYYLYSSFKNNNHCSTMHSFQRLEQRTREEEYDRHLNEINSSLENKKLQIERLEEEKIRKVIEKKYQDVLKKVGIQEDRLNRSVELTCNHHNIT